MIYIYSFLKILPSRVYIYLQNYKRLLTLPKEIRTIVNSLKKEEICLDFGANVEFILNFLPNMRQQFIHLNQTLCHLKY